MNFFKTVFSDDPEDPSSDSESASASPSDSLPQPSSPNPSVQSVTNAWAFGSTLFKTLASKSESVIETYRRDLEEFSSGLKKETATIREVASRAVKDLPARLESGAAVAQESLESVGQAIDTIGNTVSDIIVQGKDSILAGDDDNDDPDTESSENNRTSRFLGENYKPYNRVDATIRAIQCDVKTYCEEPEDLGDYSDWKLGFVLEDKEGEIQGLFGENRLIGEIFDEVVPSKVDRETFWSRYFYKIYRVKKAEEARAKLVKRAIQGEEEEELSWDVDDDDYEAEDNSGLNDELKKKVEKRANEVENLHIEDKKEGSVREKDEKQSVLEGKSYGDEKGNAEGRSYDVEASSDLVVSEGKNDNSDFSVISSQPSSHEEDDLGWDEIEDIGSGDEGKMVTRESTSKSDLHKRLTVTEDEEELAWDIEDDDEPVKS